MSVFDYGPVAVSRMKDESKAIFEALEHGRRVPISRRGIVVAAIEPAEVDRFGAELAAFAVAGAATLPELSATQLSQGSPGEFVRLAESGTRSYVTRNNKVYGVLVSQAESRAARPWETVEFYREREAELTAYEQAHPQVTADELLAETERLTARAIAAFPGEGAQAGTRAAPAARADAAGPAGPDRAALEDALTTMATTLRRAKGEVERATALLAQVSRPAVRATH